jgi:3-dehydroquinate dehydratase-1
LERACAYGDVGKIATTAHSTDDVLAMLGATRERTAAGDRVATMCMGEAGRHSRAVAPLYGSRIGYAPVDPSEATAPGQYDLATLRRLVDELSSDA